MNLRPNDVEPFPQCERFAPAVEMCAGSRKFCNRLAILLLLLGLTGLSASAKDGQYHRASNLEHESSLATKMNVPPTPVILSSAEAENVARIIASTSRKTFRARFRPEPLPTESVGVTVAMQHRSPPQPLHS